MTKANRAKADRANTPTNVLFMCPHSAGKSLAAATYFRAAAARLGLDVSIEVAGPDPDEVNMPHVVEALTHQGYTIGWDPRLISEADTVKADVLISVGCEAENIPTSDPLVQWEVPLISVDPAGSLQAIHELAEQLATELCG